MLDFLRRSASGIIVKTLLGLLILSFAAWGIGDVFRSKAGRQVVASVGEIDILPAEFTTELSREMDRLKPILGQDFTTEQAKLLGIGNGVIERLVNTRLFDLGAHDLGLGISDGVVLSEIRRTPDFFNDQGQFDRFIFDQLLRNAGFTEDSYVALIRRNLMRTQYLSPANDVEVPTVMARLLVEFGDEQRVMETVRIDHAHLTNLSPPTNDDLMAFHKDNSQFFMAPETRRFSALVLNSDDIAKNIDVSEDELMATYDDRIDEFETGERRKLKQILVSQEADIKKAQALLSSGKSLGEAATAAGANANVLDIGFFERTQLLAELQEPVFSAALNTPTQPIKSVLGWHIIEVVETKAATTKGFAEVSKDIATGLKAERALDVMFEMSTQLEDLLAGGATFEEAARELGLSVSSAEIDATGRTLAGKFADVEFASDMVTPVFVNTIGDDIPVLESTDGKGFFAVRIDDIFAPSLKPFAEVSVAVEARFKADGQSTRAAKLAETLMQSVQGGKNLSDAAKTLGLTSKITQPFNREGAGLKLPLPTNMLNDAFRIKVGDSTSATGTGAHVVATLKEIRPANTSDQGALDAASGQVLNQLRSDLLDQLSAALRLKHTVSINRAVLDDVY